MYSALEVFLLAFPEQGLMHMFSFMLTSDIITLAKTSKGLRCLMQFYMGHVWDFNEYFETWFPQNSNGFREVLRLTGGVVSGSQALQFFDRSHYSGSDLDVFVRAGGLLTLATFLKTVGFVPFYPSVAGSERYGARKVVSATRLTKMCLENSHRTLSRPVVAVYNFKECKNGLTNTDGGRVVQLVVVTGNPIHHVLFQFHSTAVMNFITWDRAVSVFPRSTLVDRVSFITNPRKHRRFPTWIKKYKDRGFRMVDARISAEEYKGRDKRFVGDQETFEIKFSASDAFYEESRRPVYGKIDENIRFAVSMAMPIWMGSASPIVGRLTIQDVW